MSADSEITPPLWAIAGESDAEPRDVRDAIAGDSAAFHRLVDRHAEALFRVAVAMVGSPIDAEDVLQEAMTGAYRGLAKFQSRSSVKTWLTRIVITQAARFRRKRKRQPGELDPQFELAGSSEAGSAVDARLDLQSALSKLSPPHRQVLVLREIEQLSYDEIADVLNVPKGTIESRLHRARGELRKKLEAYET